MGKGQTIGSEAYLAQQLEWEDITDLCTFNSSLNYDIKKVLHRKGEVFLCMVCVGVPNNTDTTIVTLPSNIKILESVRFAGIGGASSLAWVNGAGNFIRVHGASTASWCSVNGIIPVNE